MISNTEPLENAAVAVLDVARSLIESSSIRTLTDDALTALATTAGTILRGIEAILIETAGEVEARSKATAKEERFAVKRGCRDAVEFLQRATGVGGSAAGWVRGARMVRGGVSFTTGEALPPALPGIRTVLGAGRLTADALLTLSPVVAAQAHASVELIDLADRALSEVAAAVGALPVTAAELRNHAVAWSVLLDQDGQEPGEDTGAKRALHLTPAGDGYLKIKGTLVPEVGAVLQRIIDATTNPRAKGVRFEASNDTPKDPRTPAQQRHDALATALNIAASAAEMPTVTGAAPTLVVHVTEHAALTGTGRAFIDGSPVTTATARHAGCVGTIHRVTTAANGRIRAIHTTDRVFNIYQRRAIELRDGGCVIPGCTVKAAWCEIHHVREWHDDGETHTDNGVLLCWYHHRYLDTNGWNIRTTNGTPETRAPAWIDPRREWRGVPPPAHRVSPISRT